MLFAPSVAPAQGPRLWYEDLHTDPDVEYVLTDGARNRLPTMARPFPFFFVVRYLQPHPGPDTYACLLALNRSSLIRSAVDLSDLLPTNLILP